MWKSTRKRDLEVRGGNLHGLYITDHFGRDRALFWFALIIELSGIGLIMYGGLMASLMGFFYSLGTALFIVIFDVVGVVLHHRQVGQRNLWRCKVDLNDEEKEDLLYRLNKTNWPAVFGWLFLIASAVLKIGSIWMFVLYINDTILIILTVLYIVVAYIHGCHTGYWWFEFKAQAKIDKEHEIWARARAEAKGIEFSNDKERVDKIAHYASTNTMFFQLKHKLERAANEGDVIEKNGHKIQYIKSPSLDVHEYELISRGLLLDDDIREFCQTQPENIEFKLAVQLRGHQIRSFN